MRRFGTVFVVLAATTSVASANIEFGGIGGLHTFSEDAKLGVPDPDMPEGSTSLKNSALFGVRLGVYFGPSLGVEAEGGAIPTEPRSVLFDVWNAVYRAHVVYQLRAVDDKNLLVPFALAGAGAVQIVESQNEDVVKTDIQPELHVGVGAKYRTANGWGVRLDVRGLLSPKVESGFTPELEILLGIYKEFGRKTPPKVEPQPLPVDDDPDKDGIAGATDKCPNEAEDKDSFQDEDGCPDADNDADGIADATDKCAMEPEDKDSFQDEDGCPDPDNDGDGVPDAADKCGDQPETKNGFQDDDGCPDEIPEQLKKFTGVIQGINFKVNDATLVPGSTKTLDKAIAVLQEFKDVKLEIQGHTDDQPLRAGGKFPDNTALSQARAETVKAYFVSKGIEESRLVAKGYGDTAPLEPPTGLKGGKLNAARAKNRRVEFKLIEQAGDAGQPAATPPATDPATEQTPPPTPAPAPAPKQ